MMNEASSTEGEKLAFLSGLKQYLDDKGKVLIPYPRLAGKVIDLHDLYNKVTTLGGYQKVTEKELWDTFLIDYNYTDVSATLSYGLKTIYQRFLEAYERVHHFGDDEGSKKPRFDISIRSVRRPNLISEYDRAQHGLSATRLSEARFSRDVSDYERLAFSLISCLPNEVDFAINACTLLSGESRHVLRLSRCPQVLEALLLHAGIVSDGFNSYLGIADEWARKTEHNLIQFWKDTVNDHAVLDSMLSMTLPIVCKCKAQDSKNAAKELQDIDAKPHIQGSTTQHEIASNSNSSDSQCPACKSCRLLKNGVPHRDWSSLFQSKRAPGVQDYEGQRVLQIALVLLNLSFEDFNVMLLARNRPLVRFVFLCVHSNYSALRQTGLDILGNISTKMDLVYLGVDITQCTYRTLQQCVLSQDKFDQIRGFEILGNLCRSSSNKDCLILTISDQIYTSALHLLTLGDIELILAALEALYGMSKLGEETCTHIMLIPGSIGILICLITINVRTFGADQLQKIRIAKRILPSVPVPQQIPQRAAPPQHYQVGASSIPRHVPQHPSSVYHQQLQNRTLPQACVPVPQTQPVHKPQQTQPPLLQPYQPPQAHHAHAQNQPPLTPTHQPQQKIAVSQPQAASACPVGVVPMYTHTESQSVPPVYHYIPAPPSDIVLDKSPESFAQLWVWATYESCRNEDGSMPRVEVFAQYAAAASRYGMCSTKQVLPAAEFGRCLQQVFPRTASRLFKDTKGQPLYHITGIRKRPTPLPVPGHHPQSPIQAHSSGKMEPTTPTSPSHSVPCTNSTTNAQPTKPPTSDSMKANCLLVSGSKSPQSSTTVACSVKTSTDCTPVVVSSTSTDCKLPEKVATAHNAQTQPSSMKLDAEAQLSSNPIAISPVSNDLNEKSSLSPQSMSKDSMKPNNLFSSSSNHIDSDVKPDVQSKTLKPCSDIKETSKISSHLVKSENKGVKFNADIVTNHCDKNGTDISETNCAFSDKSGPTIINSVLNSTHNAIRNHATTTVIHSTDAVMCNGELPSITSTKKASDKIPDPKKHANGETIVDDGSIVPVVNGNCESDAPRIAPSTRGKSCASISPQISPIGPDQLQQKYNTQKQNQTNNAAVSASMVATQDQPNFSQQTPTIAVKRRHAPDVQTSGDTPSAKVFKPAMETPKSTDAEVEMVKSPQVHVVQPPAPASQIFNPAQSEITSHHSSTPSFDYPSTPSSHHPSTPSTHYPTPSTNHPTTPVSHHPKQTTFPQHSFPQQPSPAHSHAPSYLPAHSFSQPTHLPPQPSHLPPQPSPAPSQSAQKKPPTIDLMAANASLMVLFRNSGKHTFEDASDEKEDPISRSIRLTSVLILINICRYSDQGRSMLQRYQSRLAYLAMSGMDCSPMLAKLLAEMDR